jgi:hypothetical protein
MRSKVKYLYQTALKMAVFDVIDATELHPFEQIRVFFARLVRIHAHARR